MVRPEVIQKRLEKLEEYLAILEKIKKYSREEFLADPERYGSAERFLQLSIEALDDMGNHLVADSELGVIDSAADIPRLLHEHGHVDAALQETWVRMIGFRNILVHDYLDIDRSIVYDALQSRLKDIRALMRIFAQFL
jgi:uncharacterized protein YutE (UPF0331/DUF86 family)